MSRFVFKLPDLGEGTVEAEIVEWRVRPGDVVAEDEVLVEVMTDKAAVEVPSPVSGRVLSTRGAPGEKVPVGSELIVLDTAAAGAAAAGAPASVSTPASIASPAPTQPLRTDAGPTAPARAAEGGRVLTSPAIRRRAHESQVDLRSVPGSGSGGRILPQDFEAYVRQRPSPSATPQRAAASPAAREDAAVEEVKIIGLRRVIAQRMAEAKRNIPHFAYVEEVDVTELEALRSHLNAAAPRAQALTYLPFIALALVRVLPRFPQCNAHFDAERSVLLQHRAVHLGIATQTGEGLKVAVLREAQRLGLRALAEGIRRVTGAARDNRAQRSELSGSTITLTSLGKLGGIVSTPIINAPETAIIGVNRAVERPVVRGGAVTVRRMMNLSCSFDHRIVDGFDAASMVQALRERLENPATLFMTESDVAGAD